MIVEGPVSLVGPEAAYGLVKMLAQPRRWARDNGITLQGPLAAAIEDFDRLAAIYARQASGGGRFGISGIPLDGECVTMPLMSTDLDAKTVGRLLGCGERNVRQKAQRGTLPGARKSGGGGSKGAREQWRFDPAAIAELVGPAALMAVLEEAG